MPVVSLTDGDHNICVQPPTLTADEAHESFWCRYTVESSMTPNSLKSRVKTFQARPAANALCALAYVKLN